MNQRILIVGGVAGGASCAARLRRLDEHAEIHIFEKGPYVSFANCGLPYFVGGVIPSDQDLLVASADLFRDRFAINVHELTEVVSIDREASSIEVRSVETGETHAEHYDFLVLSPGSLPIRPPLPGIDLPGIYTLRNIPDSRAIRSWIEDHKAKSAVVVGGGFIGLEMAENFLHRGMDVTVVEMLNQVMPPLDPEIAGVVANRLRSHGATLALGDGVAGFERTADGRLAVKTASGKSHAADLVILSIGVRPDVSLAKAAGLDIGKRGGIVTNDHMQTSDPKIFAVGDAVEVKDLVLGGSTLLALAGPANRQGRIAADVICGRHSRFRGVQGTAICGVCGLQVAATGASEKALIRAGDTNFEKITIHPNHHSGYYPGAKQMTLKVIFRPSDGSLLGAQGVGEEGVDRRIDVIATLIQKQGTVFDLEEAELCYAPQFGAAKDAANFAGMVAADLIRGDMPTVHWSEPATGDTILLDVRSAREFAGGHAAGAVHMPVEQIRSRLSEIPAGKDVRAYCAVGIRGYLATRILTQHGIAARNLSGGWLSHPSHLES
jgi:NADPH-dependent 2,4-dienoyl-CoA reductase/sulfur reductase-like enzyme/rhodanese-related sulfurtransferase